MTDDSVGLRPSPGTPCLYLVSHTLRCGLPEFHEAHDPLGKVPWSGGYFEDSKPHVYDPTPLCPEDEPPLFGDWAAERDAR